MEFRKNWLTNCDQFWWIGRVGRDPYLNESWIETIIIVDLGFAKL